MKSFFLLLSLTICVNCRLAAQLQIKDPAIGAFKNEGSDSLFAKYLSDTLNACSKIKELVEQAKRFGEKPEERIKAIERCEIAFALEPYATDSLMELSKLHSYFGALLYQLGALDLSMQNWRMALELCRKAKPEASDRAYNILGSMAGNYLRTNKNDSALFYYRLALREAEKTGIPLWIAGAYNNIGILMMKQGKDSLARENFSKAGAILELRVREDSILRGSIDDNLAELYVSNKDWENAMDLYKSNVKLYASLNEIPNLFQAYGGAIEVRIQEKKIGEAKVSLEALTKFFATHHDTLMLRNISQYYSLQNEYAAATGNWKDQAWYQQKIFSLRDTLSGNDKTALNRLYQSVTYSQIYKFKRDIQSYQANLASAQSKASENLFIALITALFSASVLLLLFLYFRNRHRLQHSEIKLQQFQRELAQKELGNQKLLKENIEQELNHKKGDLQDLGLYLTQLKDVHGTVTAKLSEIKFQKGEEQKKTINALIHELDSHINSNQRLGFIQESITQVNHEFYNRLLKTFPDLTKSEAELCGYFKLNMSGKEISVLKGMSQESVKMARYRLRKKLNLKPEDDIYAVLLNF